MFFPIPLLPTPSTPIPSKKVGEFFPPKNSEALFGRQETLRPTSCKRVWSPTQLPPGEAKLLDVTSSGWMMLGRDFSHKSLSEMLEKSTRYGRVEAFPSIQQSVTLLQWKVKEGGYGWQKIQLGPWWCPKFDYAARQNRPGYVRCSKAIWVWFDRRKAHVLLKLDLFYHLYVSHSSSGTACWERCSLMTLHLHDFYTPWFLFKRLVPAYIYKYMSNFNLQKLQEDPKSLSIPGGVSSHFSHLLKDPIVQCQTTHKPQTRPALATPRTS